MRTLSMFSHESKIQIGFGFYISVLLFECLTLAKVFVGESVRHVLSLA
jgi:hypothetical protein